MCLLYLLSCIDGIVPIEETDSSLPSLPLSLTVLVSRRRPVSRRPSPDALLVAGRHPVSRRAVSLSQPVVNVYG
jgi:hypothetical protein